MSKGRRRKKMISKNETKYQIEEDDEEIEGSCVGISSGGEVGDGGGGGKPRRAKRNMKQRINKKKERTTLESEDKIFKINMYEVKK